MRRLQQHSGGQPIQVESKTQTTFKRTALASAIALACGTLPGVAISAEESAGTIEEVVVTAHVGQIICKMCRFLFKQ